MTTNSNDYNYEEYLSEKEPADTSDAGHTPPQHRTRMVAGFRSIWKWIKDEQISKNEEEHREGTASLRDSTLASANHFVITQERTPEHDGRARGRNHSAAPRRARLVLSSQATQWPPAARPYCKTTVQIPRS